VHDKKMKSDGGRPKLSARMLKSQRSFGSACRKNPPFAPLELCPRSGLAEAGDPPTEIRAKQKGPGDLGAFLPERVTGVEPATLCLASIRSSQLSYTRTRPTL
jgi:hypothetical protein